VFFRRRRAIGAFKDPLLSQAARGCAFVQVFGASGVGKSSLVRAGVIPTITQPGVTEGIGMWRWCALRPSDSAGEIFDGLAVALLSSTVCPSSNQWALPPAEWKQYVGDEPYQKTCPNLPSLRTAPS
jgi:hypothetical protein